MRKKPGETVVRERRMGRSHEKGRRHEGEKRNIGEEKKRLVK